MGSIIGGRPVGLSVVPAYRSMPGMGTDFRTGLSVGRSICFAILKFIGVNLGTNSGMGLLVGRSVGPSVGCSADRYVFLSSSVQYYRE